MIPVMCCDTVNRGVAYADGKIFLHQADTTLVALDAKTGKVVWRVKNGDPTKGATITSAPLVVKDKVYRRHLAAASSACAAASPPTTSSDGKLVWTGLLDRARRRDADRPREDHRSLGKPVGKDSAARRPGKATSGRSAAAPPGAGTRYDPELNLIYYGTGNPSTWNPVAAPRRQQVVDDHLRARRRHRHGEVGLPDDAARRVGLRRRQRDDPGRHPRSRASRRKALVHFDRNGFGYTLDRDDRRAAGRREVRPGGELGDARRHEDRPAAGGVAVLDRRTTARTSTPRASARRRSAPRTSSRRRSARRPACSTCRPTTSAWTTSRSRSSYTAGQPYVGATLSMYPAPGGTATWATSSPGTPARARSCGRSPSRSRSGRGALATAGDVVFYGTLEGYLKAVDAEDGNGAVHVQDARPASSATSTPRMHKGKQYVGVLSGIGGWAGIGLAAGLTQEHAGLGAGVLSRTLSAYTQLGGELTVFALPD